MFQLTLHVNVSTLRVNEVNNKLIHVRIHVGLNKGMYLEEDETRRVV
jgi:hypothetical protein